MIVCLPVTEIPADVQEFATRLFNMARGGDLTLLDYVDQGVAVDMANQDGNTFLMLASYAGHVDLTRGLIERGADVNKFNERGQAPLAGVVFKKEDALIDVLLAAGADPTAGTPDAISTAKMFERDDLVEKMSK